MGIVDLLLKLALVGGTWVLYLLIILSVIAVWVMIERWLYFRAIEKNLNMEAIKEFEKVLAGRDVDRIIEWLKGKEDPVFSSFYLGFLNYNRGVEKIIQIAEGAFLPQKESLERGLTLLGTLGNNAPFIGLLGTVLGIIKAFADLAVTEHAGPQVVMAGISEALVSTAVGLLVAIPCVIAYNIFNRRLRKIERIFEQVSKMVRGYME